MTRRAGDRYLTPDSAVRCLLDRDGEIRGTELAGAEVLAVVMRQQLSDTRVELGTVRAISEELGERADKAEARLRAVLHPEAQA